METKKAEKETSSVLFTDYKILDNKSQFEYESYNLRGSVRMLLGWILSPFDIEELRKKYFTIKLP